jgi:hypothetical protein
LFQEAFPTLEFSLLRLRRIVLKFQFKAGSMPASALAALPLILVSAMPSSATAVSDPPNDFLSTFRGPHNGDLDVVAANVTDVTLSGLTISGVVLVSDRPSESLSPGKWSGNSNGGATTGTWIADSAAK